MPQLQDIIKGIDLFKELTHQEIEKVASIIHLRTYKKKEHLFSQGDERTSVFMIKAGIIKIYKLDLQGNEQIVNFLGPGELFPHTGFFDQAPYPAYAEVYEDALLAVVPLKDFEKLLLEHPTIAIKAMRMMSEKIRDLQGKLQEFSANDVNLRIISALLRLVQEHGREVEEGIEIDLSMTNHDIAKLSGTTRETVNRLFNHLKKDHILYWNKKKITILDLKQLKQYKG